MKIVSYCFYIAIICLLIYISISRLIFGSCKELEFVSSCVAYPFLIMQKTIVRPVAHKWQTYKTRNSLADLVAHYKSYTEKLQTRLIELEALHNFDQKTKELVDFAQRYKHNKAIVCQVLLRNHDNQNQFFIIDKGSTHNVAVDMAVVYKNCLVGRVSHVYRYYSKVLLITDRSCKIAAYCAQTGAHGIHEGLNKIDNTSLTFVNHLDRLAQDDLIISSGEGLVFPAGFALGRIKQYEPDGFSYSIIVEPLLDFNNIDYCCIVQKGAEHTQVRVIDEPLSNSDFQDIDMQK